MTENTFQKVGSSNQRMYSPRKILACGYPPQDHDELLNFFKRHGFGEFPVLFVPETEEDKTLRDVIESPHLFGYGLEAGKIRAVILSGLTEKELHRLLAAYRSGGFPRPLLATLTPTSETWTVRVLLETLQQEAEEMRRLRQREMRGKPMQPVKGS